MATMSLCCGALGTNLHLAKTRPERSGFWGRIRNSGFNLNNNAGINQLPKSLRIHYNAYIRPDFVASALTSDDHADLMQTQEEGLVPKETPNDKNVVSIILGGGAGTQLLPLTRTTATPAVALAGCYKMIDIPMSNCINSGINKIFVLTQFNSASLNRHIHRTYHGRGINFGDGFVEVLAATQTSGEAGKTWFQGTADAVRKFLWMFEEGKIKDVENILILSGDQLYRMNYMEFVQNHIDRNADITISCLPVNESRASKYGLMKVDATGRVYEFSEKPKGNELNTMRVDTSILGLVPDESYEKPFIASMGVYVFKVDVLLDLLRWRYPKCNDFGSEVIPLALKDYNVQAYHFNDYWEDIGTLQSFYEANLALTQTHPKFEFYDSKTPIYTSPKFLPPTKMDKCKFKEAIISHGCFLGECTVENSIVGERSRLEYGVEMKDTVMMGADYYQTDDEIAHLLSVGKVPIGVGVNSKIRKCIIDKNARIGKNVTIMNKDGVQEADRTDNGFCIRSGIVIVMEKATIVDGTII